MGHLFREKVLSTSEPAHSVAFPNSNQCCMGHSIWCAGNLCGWSARRSGIKLGSSAGVSVQLTAYCALSCAARLVVFALPPVTCCAACCAACRTALHACLLAAQPAQPICVLSRAFRCVQPRGMPCLEELTIERGAVSWAVDVGEDGLLSECVTKQRSKLRGALWLDGASRLLWGLMKGVRLSAAVRALPAAGHPVLRAVQLIPQALEHQVSPAGLAATARGTSLSYPCPQEVVRRQEDLEMAFEELRQLTQASLFCINPGPAAAAVREPGLQPMPGFLAGRGRLVLRRAAFLAVEHCSGVLRALVFCKTPSHAPRMPSHTIHTPCFPAAHTPGVAALRLGAPARLNHRALPAAGPQRGRTDGRRAGTAGQPNDAHTAAFGVRCTT